jgi:hypothetical protein
LGRKAARFRKRGRPSRNRRISRESGGTSAIWGN